MLMKPRLQTRSYAGRPSVPRLSDGPRAIAQTARRQAPVSLARAPAPRQTASFTSMNTAAVAAGTSRA